VGLGTFVAGRYTGTYNSVDLGIMEGGYEISWAISMENIDNTDAYGDTVIDQVLRGMNVFAQWNAKEYKAGPLAAATPLSTLPPTGTSSLKLGLIGRLATDVAATLVLSATAGTPAATSPASLTAAEAILAEGYDVRLLFDSRHRKVPVRMRLLPYTASTDTIFFSTT
jgi:hypothetical protein